MPSEIAGKSQVIECLEHYLQMAKEDKYGIVAVIMIKQPNMARMDCVGELNLQKGMLEAADMLKTNISKCIESWEVPKKNPSLTGNYVVYNMANGPLGFDFTTWAMSMEMWRRANNYPAPLKVGLWLGTKPEETVKELNREMWRDKVFRPFLKMIGAEEDPLACYGDFLQSYCTINMVNLYNNKENPIAIPDLVPTKDYDLPKDCVTITLREAEHDPMRNSKTEEWIKFAKSIPEKVIFVRDTAKADEPIEGFATCPLASTDLDARLWLYNNSKANLFVSNGPSHLAMFGKKPFLIFIEEDNETPGSVNTKQFWHDNMGIELGEQYPWQTPQQKIVWAPDTAENITKAWKEIWQ